MDSPGTGMTGLRYRRFMVALLADSLASGNPTGPSLPSDRQWIDAVSGFRLPGLALAFEQLLFRLCGTGLYDSHYWIRLAFRT